MWGKVEFMRNNSGIDELKAGDVTNNIFGTEHHCWAHRPGRAPPQRSLFCWDLGCGHIRSAQQHHILSWVYGVQGQRAHGRVSVVKQMINNRREESRFPKASMIHYWETTEYWWQQSALGVNMKTWKWGNFLHLWFPHLEVIQMPEIRSVVNLNFQTNKHFVLWHDKNKTSNC